MRFFITFIFSLIFFLGGNAQFNENGYLPFLTEIRNSSAIPNDYNDFSVTNSHISKRSKVSHYYLNQRFNGIEVKNAVMSIHINAQNKLIAKHNQFLTALTKKIEVFEPELSALDAIISAAQKMGYNLDIMPALISKDNDKALSHKYSGGNISQEEIPVKLKYQPLPDGSIRLAWDLSILEINSSNWWNIRVDAVSGDILDKENWTLNCSFDNHQNHDESCTTKKMFIPARFSERAETTQSMLVPNSYNVYPLGIESPSHGSRNIEVSPADAAASPFGWHDTNGVSGPEHSTTKGNNVEAKDDIANDNETTIGAFADGGVNLDFDFPLNFGIQPASNLNAAITNLFYWNNVMHDVWYQYGFDEQSGNFQQNNYGNGGIANDFVRADGLDGGGTNNANFSTPTDGNKPRMQMYLWSAPSSNVTFNVNTPSSIAGSYTAAKASFGQMVYNVSGELVLSDPLLACSALANSSAIAGKIAVIDRGTCEFGLKCLNAQNAGAIAVIVCNNVGGAPTSMSPGSSGNSVTIPCVMLSQASCNTIKVQIPNIVNVTMVGTGGIQLDGDFDNGIIAHEYGHGISTRLTGGAGNSSCLNNAEQMGEGWSDWFGLMLTLNQGDAGSTGRGIGTYALGQPPTGNGIRTYKYSTDMAVNPHTYNNIISIAAPHGVGSVWCAMLWDMTWLLIDAYGFDPDYYYGTGGNNIAMALVTEALKLQPCSPGFVDGRNAILAADDVLYGGIHKCLIWKAFARRGLGFSANQGSTASKTDGTQAFDMPVACCNEVFIRDNSGVGSLRDAIACSINGDTLRFAPFLENKTIQLTGSLTVNKNININCDLLNGVFVQAMGSFPTLTIGVNQNVGLENLKLIGGSHPTARVLLNNGILACKGMTFIDPLISTNPVGTIVNNGTIELNGECQIVKE